VDLSYLEKTWGIKCKSHTITSPEPIFLNFKAGFDKGGTFRNGGRQQVGAPPAKVKFLLEFTKDVENLKELREAFTPLPVGAREAPLWFYFFDEDNVFVYKTPPNEIEGEIAGKKGDAVRLLVTNMGHEHFEKTRKIEARPGEKERYGKKK
jgi:hypothetical protein